MDEMKQGADWILDWRTFWPLALVFLLGFIMAAMLGRNWINKFLPWHDVILEPSVNRQQMPIYTPWPFNTSCSHNR